MTLKTSFFNWGVYINSVKRFKWGSFLYFVILFLAVPFVLFTSNFDRLVMRVTNNNSVTNLLLGSDYITIPVLLAMVVPTIVGVLVFNNMHSPRESVFVHGLPISRRANYISNLLAGFSLMLAPVLANGIILLIMSFAKYGAVISSISVVYWIGVNVAILAIMFSVSSATAFLTGHWASHIGINIFVHVLPLIVALTIHLISDVFLYGFISSDSFIAEKILSNTPIVWLFINSLDRGYVYMDMFKNANIYIYLSMAVAFYILGGFLYRRRKVEASGDVVAFDVFRPIFKYVITASATAIIFSIFMNIGIRNYVFAVAIIGSAIVYFACEMLINKSLKVFKYYKGYLGFVVVSALFISFFAYTNVFGYETRIPNMDDVVSAGVYPNYYSRQKPLVEDKVLIADTAEIHKNIVEKIPVTESEISSDTHTLYITYIMNNGKKLERRYNVSKDIYTYAMTKMYQNVDYKLKFTTLSNVNVENVRQVNLYANTSSFSYDASISDKSAELMSAIKKDVETLSYTDMEMRDAVHLRVDFSVSAKDNRQYNIFKTIQNPANPYVRAEDAEYVMHSFDIELNHNFKNTMAFLKANGYYDSIVKKLGSSLTICKNTIFIDKDTLSYKDDIGKSEEFLISPLDCVEIEAQDGYVIAKMLMNTKRYDFSEGENYCLFVKNNNGQDIWLESNIVSFAKNELPEILKKYVAKQ